MLVPRPLGYALTAADVAAAPVIERSFVVEQMATSTWSAWAAHHGTVRSWLDGVRPDEA